MSDSVFAEFQNQVWRFQWEVTLRVDTLVGGIPSDPKKAEGWLKSKLPGTRDDRIREMVAEVMIERKITDPDVATEIVLKQEHLNGFKRDDNGLFIEGRQAKAMLKESANSHWPKKRWGVSAKGTKSFFAEHVMVPQDRLYLSVDGNVIEDGSDLIKINQRFPHVWRGSGIQYEEMVDDVELDFTFMTDYDFERQEIGELWTVAEQIGIGASRSQGFGRFSVVKWAKVDTK
jgi:hypothetical protein